MLLGQVKFYRSVTEKGSFTEAAEIDIIPNKNIKHDKQQNQI